MTNPNKINSITNDGQQPSSKSSSQQQQPTAARSTTHQIAAGIASPGTSTDPPAPAPPSQNGGTTTTTTQDPIKHALSAAAAIALAQAEAAPPAVAPAVYHAPLKARRIVPIVPLRWQPPTPPIHFPAGASGPPGSYCMLMEGGSSETHRIFRNKKLRSGKWTSEEEAYADVLIDVFEKGHIDEKNGCTLRSFLSRKLHCAPMRISKKYAGKGIGKMVFLSKKNISTIDGFGSAAFNASMKKLHEVEEAFIKSVYPELALPFHQAGRFVQPPPHPTNGLAPIIPAPAGTPLQVLPVQHLQGSNGRTAHAVWPQSVHYAPVVQTHPLAQTVVHHQPSTVASAPTQTPSMTQINALMQSTNTAKQIDSLQQVYLSAANSVMQGSSGFAALQTPLAPLACASAAAAASQNAQNLQKVCENATNQPKPAMAIGQPTQAGSNTMTSVASQSNGANVNPQRVTHVMAQDAPQAIAASKTSVPKGQTPSPPAATTTTTVQFTGSATTTTAAIAANPSEMPDFLSAFDKITGRSSGGTTSSTPAKVTSNQFSPTFTTKSFDDLHRFLGKDLSPVTAPKNVVNTVPISRGMPVIPMPSPAQTAMDPPAARQELLASQLAPDTAPNNETSNEADSATQQSYTSLLSEAYSVAMSKMMQQEKSRPLGADSYNIFAQQSAFAASQHSAYMIKKDAPGSHTRGAATSRVLSQQAPAMQISSVSSGPNPSSASQRFYAPARVSAPATHQSLIQHIQALDASYRGVLPTPNTPPPPPPPTATTTQTIAASQNMANQTNTASEHTSPRAPQYLSSSDQGAVPNSSLRAMPNPNVVSEPSNASSDQGTEESEESPTTDTGSSSMGEESHTSSSDDSNDSSSSNDSDGSNSDTSSYKRSRSITYQLNGSKRVKRERETAGSTRHTLG